MPRGRPNAPRFCFWRDGVLWYRFVVAGEEHRGSLRTTDVATAESRAKAERERAVAALRYGEVRLGWKEAVTRFFDEVAPDALKPDVVTRYLVSLKQVRLLPVGLKREKLEDLYVDQIDLRVLTNVISERKRGKANTARKEGAPAKALSNATINRDLSAMSAVLGACVQWGALESNPAKRLERSKLTRERRDPIDLPSWLSIARVVQSAKPTIGRLLQHLFLTGMREEEGADLERVRVHLARNEANLTRTKTNRARVVPLRAAAVETLRTAPAHLTCPYVFWTDAPTGPKKGEARRYSKKGLASYLSDVIIGAGERFRVHDLRHRFAVDWLREARAKAHPQGIYELQQILGHSTITTTEVYLDYIGDSDQAEDDWPFAKPLFEMSYDEVMRLNLPAKGTAQGTARQKSRKTADSG